MNELTVDATKNGMKIVLDVMESLLAEIGCPVRTQMEFSIAFEELFVNIVHYAYPEGHGNVEVEYEILKDADGNQKLIMELKDSGTAYNPLKKEDPDVTLTAKERKIGGLGIYMAKTMLDTIAYERRDDLNCLIIEKAIPAA